MREEWTISVINWVRERTEASTSQKGIKFMFGSGGIFQHMKKLWSSRVSGSGVKKTGMDRLHTVWVGRCWWILLILLLKKVIIDKLWNSWSEWEMSLVGVVFCLPARKVSSCAWWYLSNTVIWQRKWLSRWDEHGQSTCLCELWALLSCRGVQAVVLWHSNGEVQVCFILLLYTLFL